jgi:DNA adenine methylase
MIFTSMASRSPTLDSLSQKEHLSSPPGQGAGCARHATVRYLAPLRYPGGKQGLAAFFVDLVRLNRLTGATYVEPFAGGAAVALRLLHCGAVGAVHLNDADRAVFAFWHAMTRWNERFCRAIKRVPLTLAEWDRQRDVQRHKACADLFDLGFSTFYLNRTNRSGILRAGVIGGRSQAGEFRMDARFNRAALMRRVSAIGLLAARIRLTCVDALELLRSESRTWGKGALVYLDPPYVSKGHDLYLNRYAPEDHRALATYVGSQLAPRWVVTYDVNDHVRALYKGHRQLLYRLGYSAHRRYEGRELMILSKGLRLPRARLLLAGRAVRGL